MTLQNTLASFRKQCHEVVDAAYSMLLTSISCGKERIYEVTCPVESIAVEILSSVKVKVGSGGRKEGTEEREWEKWAEKWMKLAEKGVLEEDFQTAWRYASAALHIVNGGEGKREARAKGYYHVGRVMDVGFGVSKQAREMYELGLEIDAANALLRTSLACLCAEMNDLSRSQDLLLPDDMEAQGFLSSLQDNWQQALICYQRSQHINPLFPVYSSAQVTYNQATAYDNLGHFVQASKLYNTLLEMRHIGTIPILSYRNLALMELRQGNLQVSKRILKKGIDLGRRKHAGRKSLAELLECLGDVYACENNAEKQLRAIAEAGAIYRRRYPYVKERTSNAIAHLRTLLPLHQPLQLPSALHHISQSLLNPIQNDLFLDALKALFEGYEASGEWEPGENIGIAALRREHDTEVVNRLRNSYK